VSVVILKQNIKKALKHTSENCLLEEGLQLITPNTFPLNGVGWIMDNVKTGRLEKFLKFGESK
jgi:hypothetical protein